MKKLTFFILTILLFTSCQSNETEQTVMIENKYSISIPSFLSKASDLNDVASLQYQHMWKEFYVIGMDENKEDMGKALIENNLTETYSNDLQEYTDLLLGDFERNVNVLSHSEVVDTLINNMPAKIIEISGNVNKVDIFYSLAFIEGKQRYYQIMTWTLLSKKMEYQEKMNKLIFSFKEI